jgi:hypothetical protein
LVIFTRIFPDLGLSAPDLAKASRPAVSALNHPTRSRADSHFI